MKNRVAYQRAKNRSRYQFARLKFANYQSLLQVMMCNLKLAALHFLTTADCATSCTTLRREGV